MANNKVRDQRSLLMKAFFSVLGTSGFSMKKHNLDNTVTVAPLHQSVDDVEADLNNF